MPDLHPRFITYILKLEEINERGQYDLDMSQEDKEKIHSIGKIILENGLLEKCYNQTWAKQLLMNYNVPEKYWNNGE